MNPDVEPLPTNQKTAPDDWPDPTRWRILTVLLTALFMSLVSVSIVNVALPAIQQGLNASQSNIQWVLSGYALTFGVILVSAGRAGDIMGRGGLFLAGVVVFTAASIGAGLAPSAPWLNVARFLQGLGSGLLSPQGIGMIQQYFRGAERGRAFGYLGTAVGFSVAVGPALGGLLIQLGGPDMGWRLTFLINVPVGLATIVLGWLWFPRPLITWPKKRNPAGASKHQGLLASLDPVGALLLGLAVLAVLFPFMESRTTPLTWVLLPTGLALAYVWVKWERRHARLGGSPMVDLSIFSIRSFTNGTLIMTMYFLGMTSVWVLIALYVQMGTGRSAFQAGLFGIPAALLSAYAANWAGRRVLQYGRRIVIGGLLLAILGLGLSIAVALLYEQGLASVWWLLLTLSFIGVAQGLVISPNQTLTLMDVPLAYAGSSGAIMQTGQRIGSSIGIAVITAAMFTALSATHSWTLAVVVGFIVVTLVMFATLYVAIKDHKGRVQP
ncbi:MFS transporter [Pusillimonas sp. CC-YST705]|uniref:MFS transporter n=1 Tax=Mesopusillimonas faecipullorum TaxID=2755040 RepID=A0ABS8C9L4_9BURK|nr:MFS transporter [Mesopusillimonas faecipullorum]MCB5362720.1 MFS transporter [Mesopusillimonas faecipullorum]